jgi:uncharacterized RmlC-like cupin family protein
MDNSQKFKDVFLLNRLNKSQKSFDKIRNDTDSASFSRKVPTLLKNMDKIQVVRDEPIQRGAGISRRSIFEAEADHVDEIRLSGGFTGNWHHHGKRTMYGYVVSGNAVLEFGRKGMERAVISQGDFFLIPSEVVHRDVNPNNEDALILIFNIGQGPTSQEVSSPEA